MCLSYDVVRLSTTTYNHTKNHICRESERALLSALHTVAR